MKGKARNWSITINNPTEEELAVWRQATTEHHWVRATTGQVERGAEGTLHLQGLLKTEPVPWSRVKKLLPRAHIEAARNVVALEQYVNKPETRVLALGEQRSTIRSLTPQLLHDQLTSVVYDRLHHKGIPLVWKRHTVVMGPTETETWVNDYWDNVLDEEPSFHEAIVRNTYYLREHASEIIDEAVSILILDGVYGAEYATANVAARSALQRYLCTIVIRNVRRQEAQREADLETSSSTQDPSGDAESID